MDERRDLVDREELRRRINDRTGVGSDKWMQGFLSGKATSRAILDAMPAVECPRGWTRDEVLAELDADPDAVCEWLHPLTGMRGPYGRYEVSRWHPEVRRYDVRVVRVAPEPEWVPLTQLAGRTFMGETEPVAGYLGSHQCAMKWWSAGEPSRPFPEGTLNLETGQVAVRPKGEA